MTDNPRVTLRTTITFSPVWPGCGALALIQHPIVFRAFGHYIALITRYHIKPISGRKGHDIESALLLPGLTH